ncbi:Lipoprotein-releasing system transmembrane protein LolE [Candidatus Kinetoplastibacterium sorsogonicusi]|uniref:Lipoprotein-releasing system transmembrane protein LolE n=1 Tax=Candidatus Kinetoplastidibacterium kentomonadis TaxID=1576550 RepID=A0A3S7J9R9_9PROT|nr:lipoprotein-releasing ABC transporter permease subunit [Candidatus Kinetoplastibacterium sorsogonicusi]AWD32411.1 Lipoprotein-releasing system transmembrane protein LolE [Candidatus Kinetoplastibacterium sorsogonicusi]
MKVPYEFWLAFKFLKISIFNKNKNFISFISFISSLGIALGVASLIIVISIMNGFEKEVRNRMLSFLPHIEVYVKEVNAIDFINSWKGIFDKYIKDINNIKSGTPFVSSQAIIMKNKILNGVLINGIDIQDKNNISDITNYMIHGKIQDLIHGKYNIVIGKNLANAIDANIGDSIYLISSNSFSHIIGFTPNIKKFNITGIFDSGYYEYDMNMVIINILDAINIAGESSLYGIKLKTDNMYIAPLISKKINSILPNFMLAIDWSQTNKNWFSAIQTEKKIMFIILMIIVLIAVFNLLSSLVMTVNDKEKDIAILRTFGAQAINISYIFVIQGLIISIIGITLGSILGILITTNLDIIFIFLENIIGFNPMPKEIYLLDKIPYDIRIIDIFKIICLTLVMSFLATIYPSMQASKTQPAHILRNN